LTFKIRTSNFRNASGTTNGELELPEPAPLIYPNQNDDVQSSLSSKRKIAAGCLDKRAQATYVNKSFTSGAIPTESKLTFA